MWKLFESWVPFVLAQRKEAIVALDWTDFGSDGQSTIALHLITDHGRATPLVWTTVNKIFSHLGTWLVRPFLNIAKQIIDAHAGSIRAEFEPGVVRGLRFSVELPRGYPSRLARVCSPSEQAGRALLTSPPVA